MAGDDLIIGGDVPTDLTGLRVLQLRVDRDQATVSEDRDRIDAYQADRANADDSDPMVGAGDLRWRLFGSKVNHLSVTWHAYRRAIDELA